MNCTVASLATPERDHRQCQSARQQVLAGSGFQKSLPLSAPPPDRHLWSAVVEQKLLPPTACCRAFWPARSEGATPVDDDVAPAWPA
ncbi:MAG: hypothetical protein IPG83_18190 [Novosphingobium sp.]|nr:hypothetical protein [Novosphingobium sp.]